MNIKSSLTAATTADYGLNGATNLKWSCVWKVSEPDLYATDVSWIRIKHCDTNTHTHTRPSIQRGDRTHTLTATSNTTWINYYYVTIFEYLDVIFCFFFLPSIQKDIVSTEEKEEEEEENEKEETSTEKEEEKIIM